LKYFYFWVLISTSYIERASSVEEETGWNDTNTGLLLSFLEDNFDVYKKNKSNFAKTAATKIFPGSHGNKLRINCLIL
jgi:hypothetical protein